MFEFVISYPAYVIVICAAFACGYAWRKDEERRGLEREEEQRRERAACFHAREVDDVPHGYWDAMVRLVKAAPKLPDDDKSHDPPPLV